mmetsp:Transcript_315/g.409  ORF Transcript_315/g.409 Transcript_315/m.409 type:complete len:81 (-) Transcript_315:7-249(-)
MDPHSFERPLVVQEEELLGKRKPLKTLYEPKALTLQERLKVKSSHQPATNGELTYSFGKILLKKPLSAHLTRDLLNAFVF